MPSKTHTDTIDSNQAPQRGAESVTINVPTEIDRRITPNGRAHWGTKSRLVRQVRDTTDLACKEVGLHEGHDLTPPLTLHYVIVHQSKRKVMDDDNAINAMKPIRDQIAEVLGIDDAGMETGSMTQVVEKGQAYVKVAIEPHAARPAGAEGQGA